MKKRVSKINAVISMIVLLLFTTLANTPYAKALPADDHLSIPKGATVGVGSFDGLFPSFTQADYDNDFYDYAEGNSTLELQKAELRKSSNNITNVVGTVFDQNTNQPVSDINISVKSVINDKEVANISTDQNGRFHITGLPDGHYNWILENPRYKNSRYLNYEVYAGEGTVIFTFYITKNKELVQERYNKFGDNDHLELKHDDLKHHDHDFEYPENYENVSPLSMSSPPTLSNFTVHYSGNTINPSRIYYLSAVVGSEALGYYQCKNYNMTDSQIKELYRFFVK